MRNGWTTVVEAQAERENQETDPIADGSDDSDGSIDAIPTRRDFLQAQMLMNSFLAHADHTPLAQQLENTLRAYSREIRAAQASSLKVTHITDFFHRK